ncbi:MAG: 2-hydroxyhepta-2,4-diene-1,7-dioate isomerase [Chloroflexi bacterium]|nr:MAG: 2-hydroxyhepta-2,4-diene-1,7-dioate isomerase [Chloroflexota bacterium]
MTAPMLVRFSHPQTGIRIGVQLADTVHDVTDKINSVAEWLQGSVGRRNEVIMELGKTAVSAPTTYSIDQFQAKPIPNMLHWLPPVDEQDVWAAGVTYSRSRQARQEEAIDGGDIYARVYAAERPELFFKARGSWVVGPGGEVGIRHDATWNVPEPELGLVFNPAMEIVGIVVGNDMSSRDIEGENPLYLPQAKVYTAACALGPGILLTPLDTDWPEVSIMLEIGRGETAVFTGKTHTNQIHRRPDELADFLGRCLTFPDGAVLLTGAGIVPPEDFTLQAGDMIQIRIETVGTLTNYVRVV